jgi:hypothetical protein
MSLDEGLVFRKNRVLLGRRRAAAVTRQGDQSAAVPTRKEKHGDVIQLFSPRAGCEYRVRGGVHPIPLRWMFPVANQNDLRCDYCL